MKYLLFFFLICEHFVGSSQSLVDSIGNPGFSMKDTLSDKLAEFALNNPLVRVDEAEIRGMNFDIKKNKAAWLNSLNASFNLNEGNIKAGSSNDPNVFFPRYNFSLTIPMGSFFTRAKDVQISKARYDKAVAIKSMDIERIKMTIKVQYQLYLSNKYILGLHELALQDNKVLLAEVEKKFERNEADLEILAAASKKYNDELIKKINLLKDLNSSKLELETMIGMTLEDALVKISENKIEKNLK